MKQIEPDKILEIRNSIDIVDVISNYVSLTPRGKNFFGVCPFHNDSNPSMSVAKDKQIYKCFSCGAAGNVFDFIQNYENISFIETLKKCADMANIPLDIKISNNDAIYDKYKNLYDIYENSTKFYHNILKSVEGRQAREYLESRQINDDVINTFRIGLSLKNRGMLTKFLTNNNYNKKDMLDSGLILDNEKGTYDIYANRIMFPLEDLHGRIVGFSGRIYNEDDNSKYINTRETEIFKKGETLYNYERASLSARNDGYVIVMEGFMDVIRAYTIGIKNVIATMGTSVTEKQANVIKRMAKEVYLCFDGDNAGMKATNACIRELERLGVSPKVIRLEDDMDPDEYIKKMGEEKFREHIKNAMSSLDFKLLYLKKNYNLNDSNDVALYTEECIKLLNQFDNEYKRELALSKLTSDTGFDLEFLRSKLKPIATDTIEDKIDKIKPIEPQYKQVGLNRYEKAQINLIYYMLHSKEAIAIYNKRVSHMPNKKYRMLAREISGFYYKYKKINIADFMIYTEKDKEMNDTLHFIMNQNLRDEVDINELIDYTNVIREYNIDAKINYLHQVMKEKNDIESKTKIFDQIYELVRERCEIKYR